jgi:hypothetical protein
MFETPAFSCAGLKISGLLEGACKAFLKGGVGLEGWLAAIKGGLARLGSDGNWDRLAWWKGGGDM